MGRVLVVLIVLVVLATAMILSGPKPPKGVDVTAPTPTPMVLDTTATLAPPIPSSEYKLTNGVVLAVVSVVLIVLIGSAYHLLRYKQQDRD